MLFSKQQKFRNQIKEFDSAIVMYRVANNLAQETISDMYQAANNVHNYDMRYASDDNFYLNQPNTTKEQRSITSSGARVWSRIPTTIKEAQSLLLFKTQLKEYLPDKEEVAQGGHIKEIYLNQDKLKILTPISNITTRGVTFAITISISLLALTFFV